MKNALRFVQIAALSMLTSAYSAFAADLPKEGNYDMNACFSGTANTITFSNSYSATTSDYVGTTRSNIPGGLFEKASFHCIGLDTSFGGTKTFTHVCEALFPEGDKILSTFTGQSDGTEKRVAIAGTGRFEGITLSGSNMRLGPFPTIKPGVFQNCNHQTGTYKLR